jgi:hypothetical protein
MLLPTLTHTTNRKEMDKLTKLKNATSAKQKYDKKPDAVRDTNKDGNIDKKLDGPNYPTE